MQMKDNLLNFLYDKEYFISIYDCFIHVFNYQELISINASKIVLKMVEFKLIIEGQNLFITKMLPNELLIKGTILKVSKTYE